MQFGNKCDIITQTVIGGEITMENLLGSFSFLKDMFNYLIALLNIVLQLIGKEPLTIKA